MNVAKQTSHPKMYTRVPWKASRGISVECRGPLTRIIRSLKLCGTWKLPALRNSRQIFKRSINDVRTFEMSTIADNLFDFQLIILKFLKNWCIKRDYVSRKEKKCGNRWNNFSFSSTHSLLLFYLLPLFLSFSVSCLNLLFEEVFHSWRPTIPSVDPFIIYNILINTSNYLNHRKESFLSLRFLPPALSMRVF